MEIRTLYLAGRVKEASGSSPAPITLIPIGNVWGLSMASNCRACSCNFIFNLRFDSIVRTVNAVGEVLNIQFSHLP